MNFNTSNPHGTIKKVSFRFDELGRLCLRLVEKTPQGKLFYYLKDDGSWHQYDPERGGMVEPLSNARFPDLASREPEL